MSTPSAQTFRILVVDDEAAVREEFVHSLTDANTGSPMNAELVELERDLFSGSAPPTATRSFDVETTDQGLDAVEAVQRATDAGVPFAVAFLDIHMPPGMSGIEAARRIRAIDPKLNIVIVTGTSAGRPEELAKEVVPLDNLFFFQKPFLGVECRQLAAALCGKWQADLALRQSNEQLEQRVAERTAELQELAYYDPATGLPNRHCLLRELQKLIAIARRDESSVGVVLLDLERFSFINETLGYEAGTQLLNRLADRLRCALREQDVAGRYGADEFACLFARIDSPASLQQVVERVERIFKKPFDLCGRDLYVKASIGVASYPSHGAEAQQVFRHAEAALTRSKRHVVRETTYYRREMAESARRRLSLEAMLRAAIANGQVQPYFQPQMALPGRIVIGAEALARWIQPDGRIIRPDEFIPLAEEVGLSDALFESMLEQSLQQVRAYRAYLPDPVPVSINISAHQLRKPGLAQRIRAALGEQDLPAEVLKLELTETVLLDDLALARRVLGELVACGVEISVDDFGTGYSSLSYLAELPVRALKVDRSFLSRATKDRAQARVVRAIIALGHAFGLEVIAEGVETQEQLSRLREYQCDAVQGMLIAEPMPGARFCDWLSREAAPRDRGVSQGPLSA